MKKICICFLIVILTSTYQHKITYKQEHKKNEVVEEIELKEQVNEDQNMILKIKKILLEETIYPKYSKENTVNKHVSILDQSDLPLDKNSITILAAHSGTGKTAYFRNLDRLKDNDLIELEYKNTKINYRITKIEITKKDGTIFVPTNIKNNILVLTTCMPNHNGYQLTIYAEKKN